jgi:ferrous iron transport protein A
MAFWFGSSNLSIEEFPSVPSRPAVRESTGSSAGTRDSGAMNPGFAIGLAAPGARVSVTAVNDAVPALEKRLEAMGIRVGTALEVIQHEGGSVIVRIGTTRLALGVSMAHRLRVAPVGLH